MFEPIRGGTRGGQAEFKWADVSADKDREVTTTSSLLTNPAQKIIELPRPQYQRPHGEMAEKQGRALVQS